MPMIYEPKGKALEYSFLALNHYNGCSHSCTYCYAKSISRRGDAFNNEPRIRTDVISQIRKEAPKLAGTNKRVLLSFMTDPYQPLDTETKLTRQVIEILNANNLSFQLLTKGGTRAVGDFDLYKPTDCFATTLTFIDDNDTNRYEPNAAKYSNRVKAIEQAKQNNIETWVSLEPIFNIATALQIIRETHRIVDHYKVGKLNHFKSVIDWRQCGLSILNLLEELGKSYYIKKDLMNYLDGVEVNNVDTREVNTLFV